MSDTETEREVEIVTGTIKGVIVKGTDKWQVEVQPDGSEYTKKLWTKDAELVAAIPPKIGQAGAFVCNASYWTNNEGKQVRSLWISGEADGSESTSRVATPAAAPQSQGKAAVREYAPDLKDRMIVRQTALKAAAEIVGPRASTTIDPDYDAALETMRAAGRFERWVYRDIDDPPSNALSEHDDQIPF